MILLQCSMARADGKLTIAIYAPNAPFESGEARYSFVSRLAQQVTSVAGLAAEPKAFVHAADFEAAIKKNQVDFAVVDGVYLSERGVPFPILATASNGGEIAPRWSLLSSEPGGVLDLKGKKLALAATGGKDAQFVDNALLDGELAKHFASRVAAPDIASAVAAVSLKKAECVFAPDGLAKGLRKVFDAGRVPNPGFVVVKSALPGDVVEKVKKAVLGHSASGAYDGWRTSSAEPYRAFGGKMAPKSRRPVMAEPQVVPVETADALVPLPLEPALPDLKDQFWSPTGTP
jgi:ABC-type amino acid transport substrate-binding protein